MARIFLLFSLLFTCLNLPAQKEESAEQLLSMLPKAPEDTLRVQLMNEIADRYKINNPDKCIEYAGMAEKLGIKLQFNEGVAQAYSHISNAHYYKGNYDVALTYLFKALKIYEENKNIRGQAGIKNNIGALYFSKGDKKRGLEYYTKGMEAYEAIKDTGGLSRSLNNVGNYYFEGEEFDIAEEYYTRSLKLKELQKDDPGIALSINNLANVYASRGNYKKALDYYFRSEALYEKLDNKNGMAMTYNNIGLVYKFAGDSAKAIAYTRKGMQLARSIGALELVKDSYGGLAEIYSDFNDYKNAYEYYKLFSEEKDTLLNKESEAQINELLTKYQSEKKEQEIALANAELDRVKNFRNTLIGAVALMLALAVVLVRAYRDKRSANKLLSYQKDVIEDTNRMLTDTNKNITDSIHYASRIQKAILPPDEVIKGFFKNSFVVYKPKDIVSGDFYWAEEWGNNILLAVADCTGHGVPGAFMSIVGNNLLLHSVNFHGLTKPSVILNEVNKGLSKMLHNDKESNSTIQDGMDICLCSFDRKNNRLEFAAAYNPLWLIRKGELIEYKGDKFPVGAFLKDQPHYFTNHEIDLQAGDTIYIFSDGYSDQFGGKHGKKFKQKQLSDMLLSLQDKSMEEQGKIISEKFESWKGNLEQIDDVTIIGLRL